MGYGSFCREAVVWRWSRGRRRGWRSQGAGWASSLRLMGRGRFRAWRTGPPSSPPGAVGGMRAVVAGAAPRIPPRVTQAQAGVRSFAGGRSTSLSPPYPPRPFPPPPGRKGEPDFVSGDWLRFYGSGRRVALFRAQMGAPPVVTTSHAWASRQRALARPARWRRTCTPEAARTAGSPISARRSAPQPHAPKTRSRREAIKSRRPFPPRRGRKGAGGIGGKSEVQPPPAYLRHEGGPGGGIGEKRGATPAQRFAITAQPPDDADPTPSNRALVLHHQLKQRPPCGERKRRRPLKPPPDPAPAPPHPARRAVPR